MDPTSRASRQDRFRKIDGDKNPADLLSKHSISETRPEMLVKIFGCRYMEGRAASAPNERKGASRKVTLADAAKALSTVQAEEEVAEGELVPSSSSSSSSASVAERKCAVCGEGLGLKPQVVCAKDECLVGAFHAGCSERCPSCKTFFALPRTISGTRA